MAGSSVNNGIVPYQGSWVANGSIGPFQGVHGVYGSNAAVNFQQQDQATGYQYSEPNHLNFADAFGFARVDMQPYDLNHNGGIDLNELTRVFGDRAYAQNYLTAYDLDEDGEVDEVESAAGILYADAQRGRGQADGLVTAQDVTDLNAAIQRNPESIRRNLDRSIADLDLDYLYEHNFLSGPPRLSYYS